MVAAIRSWDRVARRELLGGRQGEELVRDPPQVVEGAFRHAVPGDRKEADLATRVVNLLGYPPSVEPASQTCRRGVDDRNLEHATTVPPHTIAPISLTVTIDSSRLAVKPA